MHIRKLINIGLYSWMMLSIIVLAGCDNSNSEQVLQKTFDLWQDGEIDEVKVTYNTDLTISIGDHQDVISEEFFKSNEWGEQTTIDIHAINEKKGLLLIAVQQPDNE